MDDYMPVGEQNVEGGRTRAIDTKVLGALLVDIVDVLDKHNVRYVLLFGTMLGAVRDNAIIPWDDDGDLAVFNSDRDAFWNKVVPDLKAVGCNVPPEGDPNRPISPNNAPWYDAYAIRGGEKVDFWFFDRVDNTYCYDVARSGNTCVFEAHFFDNLHAIDFLNRKCNVPVKSEEWLYSVYGPDWQTPIKPGEPCRGHNKGAQGRF